MGPPRRYIPPTSTTMLPSTSNAFLAAQSSSNQPLPSGSQTPPAPSLGMTPASRYNYNLKVLRRRDPSIVSIFDQFSHVCIYHHDGKKWDKHGYEGSMFLFERDAYPPYGLYIMNRVGMEDYIQPIYPEDDLVHSGSFLIIRSYPEFLSNRLASIRTEHGMDLYDKYSDVYAIPNIDEIDSKSKGKADIVGLWMHATDSDSRESMFEVMMKLHSYIKKNVPYPAEFRYSAVKPPPPHKLKAVPRKTAGSNADTSDSQSQATQSDSENLSDAPSASSGELSAVDKLFLKIGNQPQPTKQAIASTQTTTTADPHPSTGNFLLDSIFASASTPALDKLSQPKIKPSTHSLPHQPVTILSPQPSAGTSGPQVLNSHVLSTILTGSAPSRTPSVASIVSHPSSREGDNEDDSESDSPYTLLDEESDQQQQPTTGASIARMAGSDLLSAFGFGAPRPGQKINGDVTPRPPLGGLQRTPSVIESTLSLSTVRGQTSNANAPSTSTSVVPEANQKPRPNRALIPFEPDSELWPYSRGAADDSSATDDDEIVELNFEETSVLSNPDAFRRALREKKSAVSLRSLNGSGSMHGNGVHFANGSTPASEEKIKGKNRRKTKKEKDAKAREEIEQGWDAVPPSPAVSRASATSAMDMLFSSAQASQQHSSPSPSPSPAPEVPRERDYPSVSTSASAPEMKTPTMTARATLAQVNGHGSYVNGANNLVPGAKGKGKVVANGHSMSNGHHGVVGPVDPSVVTESMIAAIEAQPRPFARMEKNEFMREVVMLIHTDKAFVERLYQDYIARLA